LTLSHISVRHIIFKPMPRRRCIKNFADLVAAAIPPAKRSKPVELWWQDAARVGQQGSLTRIWARLTKGSVGHSPMEWSDGGERGT
jgi:hypothetical protein